MSVGKIRSVLVLASFFVASGVQSEDYEVTVEVDEATASDAKMLGLFMQEAAHGQAVPRSVRGLAMQVAGETETAASSEKFDETGLVLLDSGASIMPTENDTVSAVLLDPFGIAADVHVTFRPFLTPSGKTQTRPCLVSVCTASGDRVLVRIPPVTVERGPDNADPNVVCKISTKCVFNTVE
jgi:hypothetical protein